MIIFANIALLTEIFSLSTGLAVISFILCVVIHEAGHFAGGLLTGYRFSSLELFGIKIVRKRSGITWTISESPCIGQCIMDPEDPGQNAGFLILGGVFANAFAGALFVVMALLSVCDVADAGICAGTTMACLFYVFSAGINIAAAVSNMIPGHNTNDGATFFDAYKSSLHTEAYNRLMKIYSGLNAGIKVSEMDRELFEQPDMYLSSLSAELALFRYQRALTGDGPEIAKEKKRLEKYPLSLMNIQEDYEF